MGREDNYKESNIKEFFRPIYRHKFGAFFIFLISVFLSIAYIYLTTPIYQTDAKMEITEASQSALSQDIVLSALTGRSVVNIETEIDVIKSRSLIGKALEKLDYKVSYFEKDGLKNKELYKSTPFIVKIYAIRNPQIYGQLFQIVPIDEDKFRLSVKESLLSKLGIKDDDFKYSDIHKFGELIDIGLGIIKIEKSIDFPKNVYFFKVNDKNSVINDILSRLDVIKASKDSYVLKVIYRDNVPQRAYDFTNTLINEYMNQNIELKTKEASKKVEFIDSQLKEINKNLKDAEIKLTNFKKSNKLMDISSEAQTTIQRLSEFDKKLAELQIRKRLIENLYNYITKNKNIETISVASFGITDPVLSSLIERLNKAIEEKAALLVEFTELHPDVQKQTQKIENLKSQIKLAIENLRNEIKNQISATKSVINRYENFLSQLPESEREFINLKRKFLVNEKVYSYLLEKRVEASITKAATISKNRIIDSAILPTTPIKPKKTILLAIGVLLGAMLGVFYGYVREFLDDTIKSKEELERLTNLPILGLIPKISKRKLEKGIYVLSEPNSIFSEALRHVRTNIQFMLKGETDNKSILISSTVGNEGKSTITVNLSAILNSTAKNVLVIDLDLRKPKIHNYFGLPNSKGITDLILGKLTIDEAIKKTSIENLDIITVGTIPPNPGDLLLSDKFKDIMNTLKNRYEYVIIDSPPMGSVSDTVFLMKEVDLSLVIFRSGYSKRIFVDILDKKVHEFGINNVGVILNGVDLEEFKYSYGYKV
jgi:capsular exopolysaccharide synthesis family protein